MNAHLAPWPFLRATELIASLCCAQSAAEFLVDRQLLQRPGLASWVGHPHTLVDRMMSRTGLSAALERPGGLRAVVLLKMAAAIAVMVCVGYGAPTLPALVVLVLAMLVWGLRMKLFTDAAGQLSLMWLMVAAVAELLRTPTAALIALCFVAAQSALAYATAGSLKLREKGWADGRHTLYILSTASGGDRGLYTFLQPRPRLAAAGGMALVAGECMLGVAMFLPPAACCVVLAGGLCMHLLIARVLGFSTYVWAFAAGYPATLYVSLALHVRAFF